VVTMVFDFHACSSFIDSPYCPLDVLETYLFGQWNSYVWSMGAVANPTKNVPFWPSSGCRGITEGVIASTFFGAVMA
jgi:hypothetical protein